jgi:hypothetical protein
MMATGGVAELLFGVKAEQKQLEDVAEPLTAEEGAAPERREAADNPSGGEPRAMV